MSTPDSLLDRTGILVLGHRRPVHLRDVLESLRKQDALPRTRVWLDGHQGLHEYYRGAMACRRVVEDYQDARITALNGHVGINRLMFDALGEMCEEWEAVIVLEDDCFPSRNAIAEFVSALEAIRERDDIFSIYGHPFLVPGEDQALPRFQCWGWAAWTARLRPILDEGRRCFAMPEPKFLAWVAEQLTPDVRRRLSVTPGRNPIPVIETFFSWAACFAVLTASRGLLHQRTVNRVVFNCGMGPDSMHFNKDDGWRLPPYNMIAPEEVWNHFDPETQSQAAKAKSA